MNKIIVRNKYNMRLEYPNCTMDINRGCLIIERNSTKIACFYADQWAFAECVSDGGVNNE